MIRICKHFMRSLAKHNPFAQCLQMTSSDKDFRFMATNDLMTELQKDSIKLDDDSERKIIKMLLKLLEDKNGEVQNLAVKWYEKVLIQSMNKFHFSCMFHIISVSQFGTVGEES